MNRSTRSRRPLEADETHSSNDKSGLTDDEETKPTTDENQVKRRKLRNDEDNVEETTIDSLDDVEEIVEMNPIISNGNVLAWKFENVNELTDDRVYSDNFTFHNINWKISICTGKLRGCTMLSIGLRYDNVNNKEKNWICETMKTCKLVNQNEDEKDCKNKSMWIYDADVTCWSAYTLKWRMLESYGFMKNNSIIVEIDLSFKYFDFSKNIPNFTDVMISMNGTMFYVNKGMLCSHSKYFFNFFVKENNQATNIELDDDDDEIFVHLIASFYPFFQPVIFKNYEKLMQLATKYECATLHSNCEQFLISNIKMELFEKLKYAEQHNYHRLMKSCLEAVKSPQEIKKLRKSAEFHSFKESTKLAISSCALDFL